MLRSRHATSPPLTGARLKIQHHLDPRIVALAVARAADAVANSFLIVVLPLYIASRRVGGRDFGLTEAAITGLILGSFGIVNVVFQPLSGWLSDRLGRRKIFILIGLVLLCGINLSYIWASSYVAVLGVRLAQAGAVALAIVGSIALVTELSPRGQRGRNMGIFNSFRLIGFGAGPLVAGLLVSGGPYRLPGGFVLDGFNASFAGAALAALLGVVLVAWLVRDPIELKPAREHLKIRILSTRPDRLLDPIFTLGVATLVMAAAIALLAPIETIVNERLEQGPVLFAVEFAAFIASNAVLQPLLGRLSDLHGRKRYIVWGLIVLIPTTLLQGIVTTPAQMIIARLLQGGAAAMVFTPGLALAADFAPRGQSAAQLSVLTVSFGLGIALGQFVSGFTIRFGFMAPFVAGAILAAIGAILVFTQIEEPEPPTDEARDAELLRQQCKTTSAS